MGQFTRAEKEGEITPRMSLKPTHMHNNQWIKEAVNLEEVKKSYMREFGKRRMKEEMV